MSLPVYVVSIAKNEEQFVRRWAESAQGADGIFLLDTGSTDRTVEVAAECGVTVFEQAFSPWRFDHARNHLLDCLPEQDAWIVNLDVDEVLVGDWLDDIHNAPEWANRIRYSYTWNWNEDGSPGLIYHGDKIVRRFSHRWKHPVHEVNVSLTGEERHHFTDKFEIHHHPDNTKSRSQYLPLLLLSIEEDPEDDRNVYYTARELYFVGQNDKAAELFKRHLVMERSKWNAERAFSMRYLSRIEPHLKEHWLLRACAEYPDGREPWVELAQHYYDTSRWDGCYWAVKRALAIEYRPALYLNEATAWGYLPHDLAAIAAYRLGLPEEALSHGLRALEFHPEDARLRENVFYYRNAISKCHVVIPTKDNHDGLRKLLPNLLADPKVDRIVVVADGLESFINLQDMDPRITRLLHPGGEGIHKMWNAAMNTLPDGHVWFINDDVEVDELCGSALVAELDRNSDYGLVCPNYTTIEMTNNRVVEDVCASRYDGTGGMGGFCMMLRAELAQKWRFDEQMVWWYGDNDLVNWIHYTQGKKNVVVKSSNCVHADSVTIKKVPREEFARIVEMDRQIYETKWTGNL